MKRLASLLAAVALVLSSMAAAPAPALAKGKKCDFNKQEKIAMVMWLIPIAGGIYTGFACKRTVFPRK